MAIIETAKAVEACARAADSWVKVVDKCGGAIGTLYNDIAKPYIEKKQTLVEIPVLYSREGRSKLKDAKKWLKDDGLKVGTIVALPNIAFKDFSDLDVVASKPKPKEKVERGTRILLKYVTSEVIEASRKLFDESEKQKMEMEQQKTEKRAEQAKKRKQMFDKTVTNISDGFNDVVTTTKDGMKKIVPKLPKKKGSEDI